MTRVLVLYYSSYGHVEALANTFAAGAREVPGATVDVKRIPELVPEDVAVQAGYKLSQTAPVAMPGELAEYDAIIIGTPTRFGGMAAQVKQFLDQLGGVWAQNLLVGKVGSVFTSSGSQHGGHESAIHSVHTVMMNLGLVVVGLPYTFKGQSETNTVIGGSPYGAGTVVRTDGSPSPNEIELAGARFQGRHVAEVAAALKHSNLLARAA
jgi:NAD(P)H dehydrogenase (quinone)